MTAGGPTAEVEGAAPASASSSSATSPSSAARLARAALPIVALLVFIGGTAAIAWAARDTLGYDFQAYAQAANRLLAGQPLYDPSIDVAGGFAIFLYPPPFAVLMIPFTWLPAGAGPTTWTIVLALAFAVGCGILPVRPSVRWTILLLAGICWPYLYSIKLGQVGPLLFLAFAAGWRRTGRPARVNGVRDDRQVSRPSCRLGRRDPALPGGHHQDRRSPSRRWRRPCSPASGWADYVILGGSVRPSTPHNFTLGALLYGAGIELGIATAVQWLGVVLTVVVVLAWWRVDPVVVRDDGRRQPAGLALLWEHYACSSSSVALLLERGHWWAIALPLLPWLGPATYPPIMFIGLIAPILGGRGRERRHRPRRPRPGPVRRGIPRDPTG
jgi:hypothetical protein